MWSCVISITFSAFTLYWTRSAHMLKNFITTTEIPIRLYYYVHTIISHYLSCGRQSTFTCVIKNTVFILLESFVSLLFESLSQISQNLYKRDKNLSLASQNICDHIFSDMKSDRTLYVFGYILGLYFVSSYMWKLSTYFEYGEVFEYTISWLIFESNKLHQEYDSPPNNKPNPKYYLEKYFENSI